MKRIARADFESAFRAALIEANFNIRFDILSYFRRLREKTAGVDQKEILDIFIANSKAACEEKRGVCQDTGYVQLYLRIGENTILDFDPQAAADLTAGEVYTSSLLRASLADPLTRVNTGNNTPVFIHLETGGSEGLEGNVMLKGGGSENLTRTAMLLPTTAPEEAAHWASEQILAAGSRGCPPYLIGIGIGGTLEKALHWSKRVLLRTIGEEGMTSEESAIAARVKRDVNLSGKGFQGLRFGETVMDVQVKALPCHIATLPIALSIGCNAVRQERFVL
ncbi:MAG: hypothetical protein A2Y33_03865 [Spirochaetes bacterium GWF1_51_8]|nr:MAG: hypothetical protein A2Y33_03865 [Spirochaetes bacterium GWF1_51_8]